LCVVIVIVTVLFLETQPEEKRKEKRRISLKFVVVDNTGAYTFYLLLISNN